MALVGFHTVAGQLQPVSRTFESFHWEGLSSGRLGR